MGVQDARRCQAKRKRERSRPQNQARRLTQGVGSHHDTVLVFHAEHACTGHDRLSVQRNKVQRALSASSQLQNDPKRAATREISALRSEPCARNSLCALPCVVKALAGGSHRTARSRREDVSRSEGRAPRLSWHMMIHGCEYSIGWRSCAKEGSSRIAWDSLGQLEADDGWWMIWVWALWVTRRCPQQVGWVRWDETSGRQVSRSHAYIT